MHTTRASLLVRLRQPGDGAAWGRFVDLYTPLLFYWARRMHLPHEDASDLVQEVFALLLEKMPNFEFDASKRFRSWLRAVAMNKWRERLRRPAARMAQLGESRLAELPSDDTAEAVWEAEYHAQVLHRALKVMKADFDPTTWNAVWQFVVVGRPAAEVGAEFGLSENAVYLAKGRVLRRLREELAGMLD